MALLEVSNIGVAYGSITALRDISLQVDGGERVAILGANGAGKTTTLRAIAGMQPPKEGEIWIDGARVDGLPAHQVVAHGVAHAPEGRELFGALTVEENLRLGFWPQIKQGNKRAYKESLDRVFGLFPRLKERRKQEAITLSGGEQQMLVVARALMSSPKVLMVDEISLGLAPMIVSQLYDIIQEAHAQGTAVVIVEQFVHTALDNTDRAYVLEKGQVALTGLSRELLDNPDVLAAYLGSESGKGFEDDSAQEDAGSEPSNGHTEPPAVAAAPARGGERAAPGAERREEDEAFAPPRHEDDERVVPAPTREREEPPRAPSGEPGAKAAKKSAKKQASKQAPRQAAKKAAPRSSGARKKS